jgi:hypothetical protein
MERQKNADVLDSVHKRMPTIIKRVGWAGVTLGPVLGFLHIVAMVFMPGLYGNRVLAQYYQVEQNGDWLAAPLAQYLILLGFALCLLWVGMRALRLILALRRKLGSRGPERSI